PATAPVDAVAALGTRMEGLRPSPSRAAAAARWVGAALLADSPRLGSPAFEQLVPEDLWRLFHGYDDQFFGGLLTAALGPAPRERLRLRTSSRMTSAGGKTLHYQGSSPARFEIAVSSHLLFTNFTPGDAPVKVNGLQCPTRLDALQRIFEHELVHLVELLVWGRSSCRRPRFRTLAHALFDHRGVTHQLNTPRQRAWQQHRLRAGERVWFQHQGRRLEGFVNRITVRATVLVPDPSGRRYTDSRRYIKFYVPMEALERR
ncbi:MAG: hypothetical protein P1P84_25595, partial [Deferrisomatales bacterium]|nr:hypothetical protein [Deferrisomatales bacterium]